MRLDKEDRSIIEALVTKVTKTGSSSASGKQGGGLFGNNNGMINLDEDNIPELDKEKKNIKNENFRLHDQQKII